VTHHLNLVATLARATMTHDVMQQRLGATFMGDGARALVFGNGIGTSQHTWRHVVAALAPHARMVRYDNASSPVAPPGSYRAEAYGTIFGYVDDLVALLDELDLRDVCYVGHSISGIIGLLAGIAAPERIGRIVLINTSPRFLEDIDFRGGFPRSVIDDTLSSIQGDFRGWAHEFSRVVIGPNAAPADLEEFESQLAATRADVALRIFQIVLLGDFRAVLPRVTQPVSVLHSRMDDAIPLSAGEYLVQQLPHATLVPLTSNGHVPQLTAPAEVIAELHRIIATWT
jgi:sigma-B regulation protein RsbQ